MQTVDHNNIKMRSMFTNNQKPYDFCTTESEQSIQGLSFTVNFVILTKQNRKNDTIGRRLSKMLVYCFP